MARRFTRRQMLRTTALAGFGVWIAPAGKRTVLGALDSPNDKLDIAFVGVGGRGGANLDALAKENVVALCDVDDARAGKAYERFPKARKFYDYREMYDAMARHIDAVVVSTPDHTHFHPSMAALRLGKHLYCEKPMAHSVWEVRQMTELARRQKVATQLGVQRHALENVRRVVELVRANAIGEVRQCHAWVGDDRGMPALPGDRPPVPAHLRWDLWLGPARERPYHPTYCPYGWRFWWDFGTGETGNWGCHILDVPFWALELKHPARVDASGPPVHPETSPKSMAVRYEFPARGERPPVTLHWHHTKDGPPVLREHSLPHLPSGVLFVGSEGMLLCDFSTRELYPQAKFKDFAPIPRTIPESPGFHREWVEACKGRAAAPTCNFEYSGPLTETVLLGNVAYRSGGGFEWNAEDVAARGNPRVAELLRTPYRKGWEV
jgi:predicted dehydrogenase